MVIAYAYWPEVKCTFLGPDSYALLFLFAFMHPIPHVLYYIELYGNTYGSYLNKLTKLNN